jgi:F-type H+-transporting ATPase subunit delta
VTQLRVTRRYVKGVIEAAQNEGSLDAVELALATIDAALKDNQDLRNLLFHPTISRARKKELLRKIVGNGAPRVVTGFTDYVIEKKREHIFPSVYGQFREAADSLRGIMRAQVTAAYEPTADQVPRLKAQLEKALGKKVIIEVKVDPALLGGMQIMIGTYILDGSIAGRLGRLSKHLQEEVGNIKSAA